jgi:hypothetical protein
MLASFRVEVFSTLIHGDASPIYQPQNILLVPPSSVEIREECRNLALFLGIRVDQVSIAERILPSLAVSVQPHSFAA